MVTFLNCNAMQPGNDKICLMTKFAHLCGYAHEGFDGGKGQIGARIVGFRQKLFAPYPIDLSRYIVGAGQFLSFSHLNCHCVRW